MSHLAPIYAVWDGNAEAMATDIGEPGVKVRQWRNRDNIPSGYWPRIIEAAQNSKGVELTLGQFIRPLASVAVCGLCELRADDPKVQACVSTDCGLHERKAA